MFYGCQARLPGNSVSRNTTQSWYRKVDYSLKSLEGPSKLKHQHPFTVEKNNETHEKQSANPEASTYEKNSESPVSSQPGQPTQWPCLMANVPPDYQCPGPITDEELWQEANIECLRRQTSDGLYCTPPCHIPAHLTPEDAGTEM